MIIQGTNKPITININSYFGEPNTISASCRLYHVDGLGKTTLLNKWGQADESECMVEVDSAHTKTTLTLSQKQSETMEYAAGKCVIEAKLRSGSGNVQFVSKIEDAVIAWDDSTILGEDT